MNAITEKQQKVMHDCKHNWLRRIAAVRLAYRRRTMANVRVEDGVKEMLKENMVTNRLKCTNEKCKIPDCQKVETKNNSSRR